MRPVRASIFATSGAAQEFEKGGMLADLSQLPFVSDLTVARAPVDTSLSTITHAGTALGSRQIHSPAMVSSPELPHETGRVDHL